MQQQSLLVLAGQCLLVLLSSLATFVKLHLAFQPSWGWCDLDFFQLLGSNFSPEIA
jgi:hypothetical protein